MRSWVQLLLRGSSQARTAIRARPSCLLAIPIVISWSLYPWAISWLYPSSTRILFGMSFAVVFGLLLFLGRRFEWRTTTGEKILCLLTCGYILSAVLASTIFNAANPDLLLRYLSKFVFFLALACFLDRRTIFLTTDVYSYICVTLVVFSMSGISAIIMGWTELSVISVVRGVDGYGEMIWSFSGFDGTARIFPESAQFARMQSFALEPGGFALALLPALYWLVLVRQRYMAGSVIALGIAATWSLGALLAMVLAATLLLINKHIGGRGKIFLLSSIIFFFVSHLVFSWMVDLELFPTAHPLTSSGSSIDIITGGDKKISKQQRIDELFQVITFVRTDFWGAGVGAGRDLLDSSISVGYANVFADTGFLGGSFYVLLCVGLGVIALSYVLRYSKRESHSVNGKAALALALSLLTCLFFGLQREQPDASFWHMWIYASFIIMYRMINSNDPNKP